MRTPTLVFEDDRLVLAGEHEVSARRFASPDGDGADLQFGDLVSLHWDWICEKLSQRRAHRLIGYTIENLDAVNALPVPGPAYAASVSGG